MKLIKTKAACKLLNIARGDLMRMARQQLINAVKLRGKAIRFDEDEIMAIVNGRKAHLLLRSAEYIYEKYSITENELNEWVKQGEIRRHYNDRYNEEELRSMITDVFPDDEDDGWMNVTTFKMEPESPAQIFKEEREKASNLPEVLRVAWNRRIGIIKKASADLVIVFEGMQKIKKIELNLEQFDRRKLDEYAKAFKTNPSELLSDAVEFLLDNET